MFEQAGWIHTRGSEDAMVAARPRFKPHREHWLGHAA